MLPKEFVLIKYDEDDLEQHFNDEIGDDIIGKICRDHINYIMIILGYKFVEIK